MILTFFFLSNCNLVFHERSHKTFQTKVSKEIGVTKSNVFKEFLLTLLASTQVFHKKVNKFLIFVIIDVLFVDLRLILDNCRSQELHLEEWTNLLIFSFRN